MKTLIGLEIHVELSTLSKMFCSCLNEFGSVPNTNVCPTCLGMPGTLPLMNKKAVKYAIMAGLAFDCDIRTDMKMDRKKYFYPDLTKGYQITQADTPIATNGYIEVDSEDGPKKIRIRRIHMEEDTGKSIHTDDGHTLMDYNRAGVPLIEIVSEPDMSTPEEAREFLENLKQRLKYIGVSDVKMEEGSLRCDVNINVVDEERKLKTHISEIKNLNSFKAVTKALEYEEKRHKKMLENGEESFKDTRRWDDVDLKTVKMRNKEEGNDYRYSVEGDIPNLHIEKSYIEEIRINLPELPYQKEKRFKDMGIDEKDAKTLSKNRALADFFEVTAEEIGDPKLAANWILSDLLRRLNEYEMEADEMNLSLDNFINLIKLAEEKVINNNVAKKLLREIFETNEDPRVLVKERGLGQMRDGDALKSIVDEVVKENPQSIEDYRNGKDRALGFLVGQAMKKSRGKGNPQEFNKMILEILEKN